jgi:peptide-methionine (S)-S-oxide reductase
MRLAALLLPLSLLAAACGDRASAEGVVQAPVPQVTANESGGPKTAIFSGGCFWGVEGVFSHVRGVTSAVSGYRGGSRPNPGYEDVSTGTTGHAESVRVTYDPAKVRYDQLLQIFFSVATDPTEVNRQGPDVGTQYRSALVPLNPEQRRVAGAYLAQMRGSGVWKAPIATRIEPAGPFYPAEGYHQDFIAKNPGNAYIRQFDLPKIEGLARLFPALYKPDFTRG